MSGCKTTLFFVKISQIPLQKCLYSWYNYPVFNFILRREDKSYDTQ